MEALQRPADVALGPDGVLERLQSAYASLAPRLRKAARYVLDNPNDIGVSSMRQIASAADVAPNTLVRMAKGLGFDGYEEMRRPFRDAMRRGVEGFPDRARWLQSLARSGSHCELFSQLAHTSLNNIETLFSITSAADLKRAACMIVKARTAYVLGMGSCYASMHGFYYIGRMAIKNLTFTPQQASLPLDDLARIGRKDVLFAATYRPYRQETVEAARYAKARGARLISLTDSRSSPIAADADVMLLAPTGTPQFFPSMLAMVAMLESLLAFIVSQTGPEAVASIESFHANRSASQVYWPDDTD
ncbi:MAG: MurR/RpiR family transcriptional regulator [Hyphomicrobiaceae bacterium]